MNDYVQEVIRKLDETIISNKSSKSQKYNEDYKTILDYFSNKKEICAKTFFIGNGGSAAIASHMTADFMKNGGMNTVSLYDNAVMTCMGNDYGYDQVFAKPLSFLAKKGDLLVAISSSGRSQNIINAIEVMHENDGEVITFTGFDSDNPIRGMGDINVYVPSDKYGMVESIHNLILQQIVDEIMERDGVSL
ncbi:MAG: SIS domain-containing protein [Lachnospiraceae bacterium]|nr:SIS domain-containing protein [Lachnospiraceae bacterium]